MSRPEGVLRLVLESYALRAIGCLDGAGEGDVREAVRLAFGGHGDWVSTVRARLGWTDALDKDLQANWARYQERAQQRRAVADPGQFARDFADEVERLTRGG